MSWEILEVLVAWASCWFHQQEESSAEASPDKCTCRNWKFTCSSCFILFLLFIYFFIFFYFFNDAKWCKHCYVTYINACTMRPAQTAGTGEKFQHNWVVSGFHELTIRKLRRATTSNSQQTRPCLSSAPCGNAFMSSSLVDNTLECQTCEMNDSCRWLHRL